MGCDPHFLVGDRLQVFQQRPESSISTALFNEPAQLAVES